MLLSLFVGHSELPVCYCLLSQWDVSSHILLVSYFVTCIVLKWCSKWQAWLFHSRLHYVYQELSLLQLGLLLCAWSNLARGKEVVQLCRILRSVTLTLRVKSIITTIKYFSLHSNRVGCLWAQCCDTFLLWGEEYLRVYDLFCNDCNKI